jgi:hypothetical protein
LKPIRVAQKIGPMLLKLWFRPLFALTRIHWSDKHDWVIRHHHDTVEVIPEYVVAALMLGYSIVVVVGLVTTVIALLAV